MNETGLPVEVDHPHVAYSHLCYRLMDVDYPPIPLCSFSTCQGKKQGVNETILCVEVDHPHIAYSHLCYRLLEVEHPSISLCYIGTGQG